jgi:hypothetical protein
MLAPSTTTPPSETVAESFDNDTWDDLINHIEERKVIPIIGPELLIVATDAGPRALQAWLAPRQAARLGIPADELPPDPSINDLTVRFMARREWSWAEDRTRSMAEGAAFILPVCVDATPEAATLVPAKFLQNHWTRLPGGEATPEFLRRLRELLGQAPISNPL